MRKLQRLGIRDTELEAEDEVLPQLTAETWRCLPAMIPAVEREYATSADGQAADRLELYDRLAALYRTAFGPEAAVPTDPDERDEFDLLKMKLERKIARLAPQSDTISQVFERYLTFTAAKPNMERKYREHIEALIARVGDIPIQHVTAGMLRDHRDQLARQLSVASVRASFTPISGLFAHAIEEELIDISPMEGVRPPRDKRMVEEVRWLPFTPDEMKRIPNRAREHWRERSSSVGMPRERREALEVIVRVLAISAMRAREPHGADSRGFH